MKPTNNNETKSPKTNLKMISFRDPEDARLPLADKYDLIAKHMRETEILNDIIAAKEKAVSLADRLERAAKHIREMEALDEEPAEEEDDVLEEVLSSLGPVIKPAPRPTQEEIDADPGAFISFPRAMFAPYFDDDMPDAWIEMIILAMLEADRIRSLDEEGDD